MKKILSCCPVASIETVHLIPADFQFKPGIPVSTFEANIWWLQESEANVCLRDESQTLHYLSRYTDREGYLSSIDQAIRECMHLSRGYELSSDSLERVLIQMSITQTPVFELFSQEVKFSWDKHTNWRQYEVVSNDWNQIQYPDKPISTHNVVKTIRNKKLIEQAVIWDSSHSLNDAMKNVKAFKASWAVNDLKKNIKTSDNIIPLNDQLKR
ncbi:hypothetical protein QNI23_013940 [Bermanella sp. WJH001]|uniref:hypothetical protein n=1 Tax=Bermanella sp. WJH001 TaxID=3048005 RepID=UPI0024BD9C15|nr:hypothetical protein [Bermanella sp. WJH001]MDJ1538094.1 hypothetical protein [Bermanella sp. WJH001]